MTKFVIEDQIHAEIHSEHNSLSDAWQELARLSKIPWGQKPNRPPCSNSLNCERDYEIIEYDTSSNSWELIRAISGLKIDATGHVWVEEFPNGTGPESK